MPERRGKARPANRTISEEKEAVVLLDDDASDSSISESQIARIRLRQRWELASVLNFLHVFEPLIESKLQISAEEIETALISLDNNLARLHISLLKFFDLFDAALTEHKVEGIPPVNKNLKEPGAWVTSTSKKLATWWQWVAEGENPLKADHGKEITTYRELDPILRLLILKALCEVRAEQDDVSRYINDALKEGTKITSFRKERIADDVDGTTYWYDGNPVTGYRLYREEVRTTFKQKWRGKGRLTQAAMDFRWETVATNHEEFQDISDKLSSSKVAVEAAVGKIVRTEIIPLFEELQKKKMRALKRQQRQAMLLGDFPISRVGTTRSCRERRPACYTFDDFDRCINEAIQISKKLKAEILPKDDARQAEDASLSGEEARASNGGIRYDDHEEIDKEKTGINSGSNNDDDGNDTNSNDSNDDDNDDDDYNNDVHLINSNKKNVLTRQTKLKAAQDKLDNRPTVSIGVRRSGRNAAIGNHDKHYGTFTTYAELKRRLRQRPTRNANYAIDIVPDSNSDPSDYERTEASGTEVSGSSDGS